MKLQTVAIALVVSLGVLALAAPVMAAALQRVGRSVARHSAGTR